MNTLFKILFTKIGISKPLSFETKKIKLLSFETKIAKLLSRLLLGLLFVQISPLMANTITAARVWPAQEYTRIAFEANTQIKHQLMVLKNPERLVIDIEDTDINTVLKTLGDRILSSDPYIKQVRVAKFKTNAVRLVVDLKAEVKANIFALPPAGEYKHRLVLDIYPMQDPLMAMLGKQEGEQAKNQPKPIVEPLPPNSNTPDVEDPPKDSEPIAAEPSAPEVQLPVEAGPKSGPAKETQKDSDKKNTDKNNKTRTIIIALDAGHGGEDPGAKGASGSREKHITLAIAKKLQAKIEAEEGFKAVLTRDGDYFVPLRDRVDKARKLKADLFISIHADAFTNPAARGSSVFALSEKGATSASARFLAKKENESDLIGGVSLDKRDPVLAKTLLDLSQTATINDSLKLGKMVLGQVGNINQLHKNKVEQAGFAVLKSPDIPSILVETAFISNPEEERKLNDDAYQDKLADSILAGIKKYFANNSTLNVSR